MSVGNLRQEIRSDWQWSFSFGCYGLPPWHIRWRSPPGYISLPLSAWIVSCPDPAWPSPCPACCLLTRALEINVAENVDLWAFPFMARLSAVSIICFYKPGQHFVSARSASVAEGTLPPWLSLLWPVMCLGIWGLHILTPGCILLDVYTISSFHKPLTWERGFLFQPCDLFLYHNGLKITVTFFYKDPENNCLLFFLKRDPYHVVLALWIQYNVLQI